MVFDVVVLVYASLGMEPQECEPETALRQIYLGTVPNELRCGLDGQATSSPSRKHGPGWLFWPKLTCPQARG